MAGYDHYGTYRPVYTTGGQGVGPYTDQWGKPRYASIDDDECRTVIVDADGTKRTILGCTPLHKPEAYVTKTETIIEEHIVSPSLTSYRHSSHPDVAEPGRGYGYAADNSWQRRPSSPVRGGYGYADQASRIIAPSTGVNWRQQPHQTGHYSGTSGGYNDYNDYSNKPAYKNNGRSDDYDDYSNKPAYKNNGRSDNYDDYYRKNEKGNLGPAINTISNMVSSRAKPSRTAYSAAALPVRGDGRLSVPTDDMERALHYLKESAKTSPWPRT